MKTSHYFIIVIVTIIIYRETYEKITLFHYSDCYHIYLKPMINIILKKNIGGHYLKKAPRKISFTKQSIVKNYEKLFKAHEE